MVNQVAFDSAPMVGEGAIAREKKCSARMGCFQPPVNRQFGIGTYLVHVCMAARKGWKVLFTAQELQRLGRFSCALFV